ncbi:unnamed protein product [Moneuplotes crassus]|uniref:Uncharacterized protein n=1 Tax=Euplotes crassus TaxID=5936 RepID=A0AAD1XWV1_EUPCR|nr:unnamed protein product [Moneuplotes crassus]
MSHFKIMTICLTAWRPDPAGSDLAECLKGYLNKTTSTNPLRMKKTRSQTGMPTRASTLLAYRSAKRTSQLRAESISDTGTSFINLALKSNYVSNSISNLCCGHILH